MLMQVPSRFGAMILALAVLLSTTSIEVPTALAAAMSGSPLAAPGGGTPFTLSCGEQDGRPRVLIGIRGAQGWWMDSVQGICVTVGDDGHLGTDRVFTTRAGGDGGQPRTFTCGDGSVMTGIIMHQGTYVNAVTALVCSAFDPETRQAVGSPTQVRAFQSAAGNLLTHFCLDGQVGRELKGRAGIWVDQLDISCSSLPEPTTRPAIPRIDGVGPRVPIAPIGRLPAVGAPGHTENRSKPVIFVHGSSLSGAGSFGLNCGETFGPLFGRLESAGWDRDLFHTVSFYAANDASCQHRLVEGSPDNGIDELAVALAHFIHDTFTANRQPVDVVGSSMGGLVTRRALAGVQAGDPGFPPRLWVEDVVTLGTPHLGLEPAQAWACGAWSHQCREMTPDSEFLSGLAHNPQGEGGTEWTLIGSDADFVAPGDSAIGMRDAAVTIKYPIFFGIDHLGIVADPHPLQDTAAALFQNGR